jgi:hypothetical protein
MAEGESSPSGIAVTSSRIDGSLAQAAVLPALRESAKSFRPIGKERRRDRNIASCTHDALTPSARRIRRLACDQGLVPALDDEVREFENAAMEVAACRHFAFLHCNG